MADPTPADATAPVDVAQPSPTKTKPVVLATVDHVTEFVVPAQVDDNGDPKGEPLVITHLGVPLSRKQAADTEALAASYGVRLVDITPADKD